MAPPRQFLWSTLLQVRGVSLATSDSFRHTCQLYADDSSFSPLSRLAFKMALDGACLGCSLALLLWCRPHRPTKSATVAFCLCVASQTAVFTLVFPCPWFSNSGMAGDARLGPVRLRPVRLRPIVGVHFFWTTWAHSTLANWPKSSILCCVVLWLCVR